MILLDESDRAASVEEQDPAAAPSIAAHRVIHVGTRVAIAAVAVQTVAHIAYFGVFDAEIGQLNVDAENNLFSWASAAVTFAAAFAAALLAVLSPRIDRALLFLGGLLAVFSLDDTVSLHEDYGEDFTEGIGLPESVAHAVWPAVFLPALAIVFVLLLRLSRRHAESGRVIRAGLVLLVVGIAAEAAAAAWYGTGGTAESWPGALEIALEEGAELGGWIFVATGLASLVVREAEEAP